MLNFAGALVVGSQAMKYFFKANVQTCLSAKTAHI